MRRKRRAKMAYLTILPALPCDLIVDDILSRLRPKQLLQLRSVCKSWRSLIDSHRFAVLHRVAHSREACTYLLKYDGGDKLCYFDPKKPLQESMQVMSIPDASNPDLLFEDLSTVSSCNGLVCLTQFNLEKKAWSVHIANPALRQQAALPLIRLADYVDEEEKDTLAHIDLENDLKVHLCQLLCSPRRKCSCIEEEEEVAYKVLFMYEYVGNRAFQSLVYDLDSKNETVATNWRSIANPFTCERFAYIQDVEFPYVNGAIHFVHSYTVEVGNTVIAEVFCLWSFDVEREVFRHLNLPEGCHDKGRSVHSVEIFGFLGVLHFDVEMKVMTSWLLVDYSDNVWRRDQSLELNFITKGITKYWDLDQKNVCDKLKVCAITTVAKTGEENFVMKVEAHEGRNWFCLFVSYDINLNVIVRVPLPFVQMGELLETGSNWFHWRGYVETLQFPRSELVKNDSLRKQCSSS